jgi:hypothetical protein
MDEKTNMITIIKMAGPHCHIKEEALDIQGFYCQTTQFYENNDSYDKIGQILSI